MLEDLLKLQSLIEKQIDLLKFKAKLCDVAVEDLTNPDGTSPLIPLLFQKIQVEQMLDEHRRKPRVQYRNYSPNAYRPTNPPLVHRAVGGGQTLCGHELDEVTHHTQYDSQTTCPGCRRFMSAIEETPSTRRLMGGIHFKHYVTGYPLCTTRLNPIAGVVTDSYDKVTCLNCNGIIKKHAEEDARQY